MKKGKCHICQKYKELTFEHIPPQKAFNSNRAKSIEGDEFLNLLSDENRMPWETEGLKYISKQRGMGMYSLCQNCNNLTGKYYGNEYIKFASTIHKLLIDIKEEMQNSNSKILRIVIKDINPLLFAKQVLSMFCSTCEHITKENPEIKDLLLNKEKKGIDERKYKLSMFLMKQYKIGYTGLQVMHIKDIGIIQVASIDAYPFGFVLEFNPRNDIERSELDITSFLNDYDCEECDLYFNIPLLERNVLFSRDYRSKKEIIECVEENKKYKEKIKRNQT